MASSAARPHDRLVAMSARSRRPERRAPPASRATVRALRAAPPSGPTPVSLDGASVGAREGPDERVALATTLARDVGRAIGLENDLVAALESRHGAHPGAARERSSVRSSSLGKLAPLISRRDFRARAVGGGEGRQRSRDRSSRCRRCCVWTNRTSSTRGRSSRTGSANPARPVDLPAIVGVRRRERRAETAGLGPDAVGAGSVRVTATRTIELPSSRKAWVSTPATTPVRSLIAPSATGDVRVGDVDEQSLASVEEPRRVARGLRRDDHDVATDSAACDRVGRDLDARDVIQALPPPLEPAPSDAEQRQDSSHEPLRICSFIRSMPFVHASVTFCSSHEQIRGEARIRHCGLGRQGRQGRHSRQGFGRAIPVANRSREPADAEGLPTPKPWSRPGGLGALAARPCPLTGSTASSSVIRCGSAMTRVAGGTSEWAGSSRTRTEIAFADAIDAPVELVVDAAGAARVHDLGAPDELPLVTTQPRPLGIDEHRARHVGARHEADELQLVDRVVIEQHLALRLDARLALLGEELGERAKWIAAALGLDEIVLAELHLGRARTDALGAAATARRTARGRRRGGRRARANGLGVGRPLEQAANSQPRREAQRRRRADASVGERLMASAPRAWPAWLRPACGTPWPGSRP